MSSISSISALSLASRFTFLYALVCYQDSSDRVFHDIMNAQAKCMATHEWVGLPDFVNKNTGFKLSLKFT